MYGPETKQLWPAEALLQVGVFLVAGYLFCCFHFVPRNSPRWIIILGALQPVYSLAEDLWTY